MLLLLFGACCKPVLAQCFNNPIDESVADQLDPLPGPFNLVLCTHPINPAPCLKPVAPNAIPVSSCSSDATQEYTLRATRPGEDGSPFTSVVWRTEYYQPGTGWLPLWDHESKDSITNIEQVSGSIYRATFGATGLKPGFRHRFRVGWCRESSTQRGCSCWSDPYEVTDPQPTSFPSLNPAPPANTTQRIEDTFARTFTSTPKRDPGTSVVGGDGLGPPVVWEDGYWANSAGNGSKVIKPSTGSSYAFMPEGALASYKLLGATHQHSYAEARWSLETVSSRDSWNFDVHTRRHNGTGGMPRAYAAKFHRKQYGAGVKPKLSIVRVYDGQPTTTDSIEFTSDSTCQSGATTDCSCMPKLLESTSQAVWLRVEVEDLGSPLRPTVTATVAWDDTDLPSCGPDINACPHKCTLSKRDATTQGQSLLAQLGEWGLDAHEGDYHISPFRAGSQ